MCDATCRSELALALCVRIQPLLPAPAAFVPHETNRTELPFAADFEGLLQPRAPALARELGCGASDGVALQTTTVEDGKSAMGFLIPGGPGVHLKKSGSYSVILKQLNEQEIVLLPNLLPTLLRHYGGERGSLLVRMLSWVRYTADDGRVFDAVLMDNAARSPPGEDARPPPAAADPPPPPHRRLAGAQPGWKPFDMKGIRLYKHERRFADAFGARGLSVGAGAFGELRRALDADLEFLASNTLARSHRPPPPPPPSLSARMWIRWTTRTLSRSSQRAPPPDRARPFRDRPTFRPCSHPAPPTRRTRCGACAGRRAASSRPTRARPPAPSSSRRSTATRAAATRTRALSRRSHRIRATPSSSG